MRAPFASRLRLADRALTDAKLLRGAGSRNAAQFLFQAAENIAMAVLTAEGRRVAVVRREHGNHQIGRWASSLPDECAFKADLLSLDELTSFATTFRYPTGAGAMPHPPAAKSLEDWTSRLEVLIAGCTTAFGVDLSPSASSPASNVVPPRISSGIEEDTPDAGRRGPP